MENKKSLGMVVVSIVGVLAFIVAVSSTSYAYFTTNIKNADEEARKLEVKTSSIADLSVKFTDDAVVNVKNIVPGSTVTKTFSLHNEGTTAINFKIKLVDVVNTFERKQDLSYSLVDGGTTIASGQFPGGNVDTDIKSLTIAAEATKTYQLKITYKLEENEDQIMDMSKKASAAILLEQE